MTGNLSKNYQPLASNDNELAITKTPDKKAIELPYFVEPIKEESLTSSTEEKQKIKNSPVKNTDSLTELKTQVKQKLPIKVSAELSSVSNTYKAGSPSHKAYSVFSLNMSYSSKKYISSLSTGVTQYHTNYSYPFEASKGSTDYNNTTLSIARKSIPINHNYSYSYKLKSTVATSYYDRRYSSLQAGIGASANLNQKTQLFSLPISLGYSLGVNRLFHKYTRSSFDTANIKNIFLGQFSLSHKFAKNFSFSFSGGLTYYQTYQNSLLEAFNFSQSLSYAFKENTEVSIGLTNKASTFNAAGESNIALFDERSTSFYGSIAHTF